jgi:hypothetical protein
MRESTKIYLLLVSLTFLAFFIGLTEVSSVWFLTLLLLSTLLKGKMIIDYFMGMKVYVSRWNNFPTWWLSLVILALSTIYFLTL